MESPRDDSGGVQVRDMPIDNLSAVFCLSSSEEVSRRKRVRKIFFGEGEDKLRPTGC